MKKIVKKNFGSWMSIGQGKLSIQLNTGFLKSLPWLGIETYVSKLSNQISQYLVQKCLVWHEHWTDFISQEWNRISGFLDSWNKKKLTNSSESEVKTSVVDPGRRNWCRRAVHRVVVPGRIILPGMSGSGRFFSGLLSDLFVDGQTGFCSEKVDVDEEEKKETPEK